MVTQRANVPGRMGNELREYAVRNGLSAAEETLSLGLLSSNLGRVEVENPREATRPDLLALGLFGTYERNLASFGQLASKAGLTERTRTPLSGDHWLVEYSVD
jgi:hypothetical protein